MAKAILFDSTKCTGCRGCQVACKQWNDLPAEETTNWGTYENPPDVSASTWNKIKFNELGSNGTLQWLFTRQACMHCTEAACVWVCPTFARSYDEKGFTTIDAERCIGCGRCVVACPFGIPKLGSHDVTSKIKVELSTPRSITYKCIFCKDRVDNDLSPACVKTCPSGALRYGERSTLIQEGKSVVDSVKSAHPDATLYGENELGGLHVMYVITESASTLGLPKDPAVPSLTKLDADQFPDWYNEAIAAGSLPVVPAGASQKSYLQPLPSGEAGMPGPQGPTGPAGPQGSKGAPGEDGESSGWAEALGWGWVGLGVGAAATAVAWTIGRRMGREDNIR